MYKLNYVSIYRFHLFKKKYYTLIIQRTKIAKCNLLVHVIPRLVFYFDLMSFFLVRKTNQYQEMPEYIFYIKPVSEIQKPQADF
jgi:hypothetical protein